MANIPMDPNCTWNYSICKLIYLRVDIDEDWYSAGNIDYDALDDLQVEFPYPFKDEGILVPKNE
jgi:hypothetical protein